MAIDKAYEIHKGRPAYIMVDKKDIIEDNIHSLIEIYTKLDRIWVLSDQPEIDNICGQISIDCIHAIVGLKKLRGRI